MENITTQNDYRVNLEVFEGPLDLLIHLIKKNDLDIYDIPIAFVLEEYMRYIDTLRELDIDLAGDFLLMAAELAHIKSRLLLPEEEGDSEMLEEDPRSDLVRRLLEYQRYKEASQEFVERAVLGRDVFKQLSPERIEIEKDGPVEGDVYQLVEAFSNILKRIPEQEIHDVAVDRISVNDRIYQIAGRIKNNTTVGLDDLLPGSVTRYDIVITFIALLEMCRLKMVRVYQTSAYGTLYVQGTLEEVSDEDMMRLVEREATGFDRQGENAEVGAESDTNDDVSSSDQEV